jgi:glucose-1-phosphate thymidylyltransferase
VFITLGDMLFENGYRSFLAAHEELFDTDVSIGVKTVDEPQHYVVAEIEDGSRIKRLVEELNEPNRTTQSAVYIYSKTPVISPMRLGN